MSSNNGGYGMNPPGGPPMNPNMVNFNTSMHSIQVKYLQIYIYAK